MALPALSLRQRLRGIGIPPKGEISPSVRESVFVLHFRGQTGEFGLKVSRLVDGTLRFGTSFLKNKNGFLRPLAGGKKFVISPLRNERVSKLIGSARRRVVVHPQAGR